MADPELMDEPETAETPEAEDEQKQGDYSGPKGNGDLPKDIVEALKDVCRKMDQRELQPRINLVARVQKSRLNWALKQHLKREKGVNESNGTIYVPVDQDASGEEDKLYTFSLYTAYGKSCVATFAQAPFGVRPEPVDPFVASSVTAAHEAESAKKLVTKVNDQKDLQKETARYAWTDGVIVYLTRSSTEEAKLGEDENGDPRPYPKIDVDGLLEWKLPIAAKEFSLFDYARRQLDISLTIAKEEYKDKADSLQVSAGGTSKDIDYSRQARISVAEGLGMQTQSGDALAFQTTKSEYWLRPSAFNEINSKTLRGEVRDYFPSGAYVAFIGETYVESRDEKMDDHISVFKAVDGDGFATQGLGDIALDPQEVYNKLASLSVVGYLRGVPHSFVDQKLVPAESTKNQRSTYGVTHPVDQPNDGRPLADHFYSEQPVVIPPSMIAAMDNLQGPQTQFLTGQQPALFGGEMGEAGKTASGYQQALGQAMGLMGLTWVPFKKAFCRSMRQAVKLFPKMYDRGTKLATILSQNNGSQETVSLDVDNLAGNFLFYPDGDENFPESWTAKKSQYQQLMVAADKNPVLGQILTHPDNLRMAKDLIGLEDLTIPGADSCEKQMQEIEEMEKQPPVPNQQSPQYQALVQMQAMGQMVTPQMQAAVPMTSSVPIDQYDDDATESATCKRWINSPAGQKAKRENQAWYQNVCLHTALHDARIAQNQNAPAQKPPAESINFKDLPPSGQVQMAAQSGIHLTPQDIAAQQLAEQQQKAAQAAQQPQAAQ